MKYIFVFGKTDPNLSTPCPIHKNAKKKNIFYEKKDFSMRRRE